MRRITLQYKKTQINYPHRNKSTKKKSTLFLAVSFYFCMWKNYTVNFLLVDFFSCRFFFCGLFILEWFLFFFVEFFYCWEILSVFFRCAFFTCGIIRCGDFIFSHYIQRKNRFHFSSKQLPFTIFLKEQSEIL